MKIAKATAQLFRVPLLHQINDATQDISHFEYLIVNLTTEDGVSSCGWAYTTGVGGVAAFALLRDVLIPLMPGLSVTEPASIWARLKRAMNRGGYGVHAALALAAADIAVWDALGKLRGEPLFRLLGGSKRNTPIYGSGVDLALTPQALSDTLRQMQEDGYTAFKLKVGNAQWRRDAARLEAARAVIGDAPLFVDANQGWTTAEALVAAPMLRDLQVGWLEEPLPPEDFVGYRHLCANLGLPMAGGETLNSAADFARFVGENVWDVLQPDVVRIGGITEWMRMAAVAEVWNKKITTHYVLELAAHMASATRAVRMVEITDHNLTHLGLVTGGCILRDGGIEPTDTPGHGVVFDEDKLRPGLVAQC